MTTEGATPWPGRYYWTPSEFAPARSSNLKVPGEDHR
jgi:hypothetical protein